MRLGQQRCIALRKAGADFLVFAGARPRGDVIENDPRGLARLVRPVGIARGDEVGLAAQDHAVVEHLEAVGRKRRARGCDVHDHLGGPDRRGGFGPPGGFAGGAIQACGTATTTLALPKPRLSINATRLSASTMLSRTRSSPVMPRCTAPRASCEAISLAER